MDRNSISPRIKHLYKNWCRVATAGDYTATLITNTPAGNIAAADAQTAINELDTENKASQALQLMFVP